MVVDASPPRLDGRPDRGLDRADVDRLDDIFHALADPTRRDIVRRSMVGASSVTELARHYPMSFAAVQKHVAVLARARLVTKERRGREQLVRANVDAIRDARRALDHLEDLWRDRMERFGDVLAEITEGDTG